MKPDVVQVVGENLVITLPLDQGHKLVQLIDTAINRKLYTSSPASHHLLASLEESEEFARLVSQFRY